MPLSNSSMTLRFLNIRNFLQSMVTAAVCWARLGKMKRSTPSCVILRYGERSRRATLVSTDTSVELPPQLVNDNRSTAAWPPLFLMCSMASGVRLICIGYLSSRFPPPARKTVSTRCWNCLKTMMRQFRLRFNPRSLEHALGQSLGL